MAEPPPTFRHGLIEWDKIEQRAAVTLQPETPCSMVAIRTREEEEQDDGRKGPPIVFPPINHENLHISPNHIHTDNQRISFSDSDSGSDSDSNLSGSTFSPPNSSPVLLFSSPRVRPTGWTEMLHSKISELVRFLWSSFNSSRWRGRGRGVFVTFRSVSFTAIMIAFLYFWRRRREDRLIGIIRERDEKMNQILDKISEMNQLLVALHTCTP